MTNKSEVWRLYLIAKTTSRRPSEIVGVLDAWAAYQLDGAVTLLGKAIENAGQELVEVGSGTNKKMEPKYEMEQILDPLFRLPTPPTRAQKERAALQKLRGLRGVKVWKGK